MYMDMYMWCSVSYTAGFKGHECKSAKRCGNMEVHVSMQQAGDDGI